MLSRSILSRQIHTACGLYFWRYIPPLVHARHTACSWSCSFDTILGRCVPSDHQRARVARPVYDHAAHQFRDGRVRRGFVTGGSLHACACAVVHGRSNQPAVPTVVQPGCNSGADPVHAVATILSVLPDCIRATPNQSDKRSPFVWPTYQPARA